MEQFLEYFVEHWAVLVGLTAVAYVLFNSFQKFVGLPKAMKSEVVQTWILYAIAEAEKEFGSGTGDIKLGKVYGDFAKTFPSLARVVSFEVFKSVVDDSLVALRAQLETEKIRQKIEAEANFKLGQTKELKERGKL